MIASGARYRFRPASSLRRLVERVQRTADVSVQEIIDEFVNGDGFIGALGNLNPDASL